MSASLEGLEQALGHRFSRPALLLDAVSHPSLVGLAPTNRRNGPGTAYERLEFLGDRVLGLAVAEWLLERFPSEREGALAKRHAGLVRRETLARVAGRIGLGDHLRLSPAEDAAGGRGNPTILGDACEAVIAALYLDGGLEPVRAFIRRMWAAEVDSAAAPPLDAKTALQEWAQGQGLPLPVYETVEQTGAAHEPSFRVCVTVAGLEPEYGVGPGKRIAEKEAALHLLRRVGVWNDR